MDKKTREFISYTTGTVVGLCSAKMIKEVVKFHLPPEAIKMNPIVWTLGTWGLYSAAGMLTGMAVQKDASGFFDSVYDAIDLWKSMKKEAEDGGSIDAGQQPAETE